MGASSPPGDYGDVTRLLANVGARLARWDSLPGWSLDIRNVRPADPIRERCQPYLDCDGDTVIDAWPWDKVRARNASYPAKPKIGKPYPLYRNEENIGSEFERFRQISSVEGGLIAKTQAAMILGVSKQPVSDLVEEKRLRQHDFFGKEFISCKDLKDFRKIERKSGHRRR